MTRFRAALDQHTHRDEIAVDQDAARAYGFAFEAPVTFVNGRRFGPTAVSSQLEQSVTLALGSATPSARVPGATSPRFEGSRKGPSPAPLNPIVLSSRLAAREYCGEDRLPRDP